MAAVAHVDFRSETHLAIFEERVSYDQNESILRTFFLNGLIRLTVTDLRGRTAERALSASGTRSRLLAAGKGSASIARSTIHRRPCGAQTIFSLDCNKARFHAEDPPVADSEQDLAACDDTSLVQVSVKPRLV